LTDGASGGSYVVPEAVDAAVVMPALLASELAPYVETIEVARGSLVAGATMSVPTLTWNNAEGSAADLYATSGLIQNMDSTIFPVDCFIEVGNDFAADSVGDIGMRLMTALGQRLAAELDAVIASGDGSTQPLGLDGASGATAVSSENGTASAATVTDIETLMHALPKQYRTAPHRPAFCMNDTTYRRIRSVPVGESDERRVFGMDHMTYTLFGFPVRISTAFADGTAIMTALDYYRLYRRAGGTMRWTSEGQNLALKNTSLLCFRGRYGGRPTLGEAVAICTDLAMTG